MSDLLVRVVEVEEIKNHPNANSLEIVQVGGWQVLCSIGQFKVGDVAVHVPPEAMVPRELAEDWGVADYLSWRKDDPRGRVKAVRLRGLVSYGFLSPYDGEEEVGTDLAEFFKIGKYEPPVGMQAGQMQSENPLFHRYTDIQNLRNYPGSLHYGEPLVVTEKIHGTNSRVGWVKNMNVPENAEGRFSANGIHFREWRDRQYELVVGTHRTQRDPDDAGVYRLPLDLHFDVFGRIFEWAEEACRNSGDVFTSLLFFGEIYGAGVQDLHYGQRQQKGYRVFDVSLNGEYINWKSLEYLAERFGLPLVPVLERGVFDFEQLIELAEGDTTLEDDHIREGVVVRPWLQELTWGNGTQDPHPKRMIFKLLSGSYLSRKGGTENH